MNDARSGSPAATGSAAGPEPAAAQVAASLAEEHAVLRDAVRSRAEPLLRRAEAGTWPAFELTEFVNYLQLEVLRQIADEEWLLFRGARAAADQLAALRRDHLELRLTIDRLTEAATAMQALTPDQLAVITRDLLEQIDAHLRAEERQLTVAGEDIPSMAKLGSQPHEWYSLTEGARIDLDRLPGTAGADAVLDRLLRMRPGERVVISCSTDPSPLWRQLSRSAPGGYGMTSVTSTPPPWQIEIEKRLPPAPLVAQPG